MVIKILRYEFSNFWWGFDMAHRLAWPTGLPTTLSFLSKLFIKVGIIPLPSGRYNI